jgi:hypothetical protein
MSTDAFLGKAARSDSSAAIRCPCVSEAEADVSTRKSHDPFPPAAGLGRTGRNATRAKSPETSVSTGAAFGPRRQEIAMSRSGVNRLSSSSTVSTEPLRAPAGSAMALAPGGASAASPGSGARRARNAKRSIVGSPRRGSEKVRRPSSRGRRRLYERTSRTVAFASIGKTRAEKRFPWSCSRSAGSRIWWRIAS